MGHSGDTRNLRTKSISTYLIAEEGAGWEKGSTRFTGQQAGQSSCVQLYTYWFARVHVR